MKSVQVRDAKATFSALVEAAERGEPTTITRHGKPAAVLVPVEAARRLYPEEERPNFGLFLLSFPGGIELDESERPRVRDIDL